MAALPIAIARPPLYEPRRQLRKIVIGGGLIPANGLLKKTERICSLDDE